MTVNTRGAADDARCRLKKKKKTLNNYTKQTKRICLIFGTNGTTCKEVLLYALHCGMNIAHAGPKSETGIRC